MYYYSRFYILYCIVSIILSVACCRLKKELDQVKEQKTQLQQQNTDLQESATYISRQQRELQTLRVKNATHR